MTSAGTFPSPTGAGSVRLLRFRISVVAGLMVSFVAALSVFAPHAFAHDSLISSNPAADSVIAQPPKSIELLFDQPVNTA
jgi:methionine-rich copper-binding protein CopC